MRPCTHALQAVFSSSHILSVHAEILQCKSSGATRFSRCKSKYGRCRGAVAFDVSDVSETPPLRLLVSDRARRSCLGLTRYRPVITLTGRAAGLGWVCRRRQTAEGPDQVTAPPGVVRLHGGPRQTTLGAGLSPSQLGVGVQRQQSVSAPRPLSVWDTEPVQAEMPRYGIDVAGILRSPSFCKMPRHFSKRLTNQALCKMSSLFAK